MVAIYESDEGSSKEFQGAFDGKFPYSVSLQFWKSIGAGLIHREELEWIRLVANGVLEANKVKGARRAEAMLKAVGLSGRDKHTELRRFIDGMLDFEATPPEILKAARIVGFGEGLDDHQLRKIIAREIKDLSVSSRFFVPAEIGENGSPETIIK